MSSTLVQQLDDRGESIILSITSNEDEFLILNKSEEI